MAHRNTGVEEDKTEASGEGTAEVGQVAGANSVMLPVYPPVYASLSDQLLTLGWA
jgi:hypothetical protein